MIEGDFEKKQRSDMNYIRKMMALCCFAILNSLSFAQVLSLPQSNSGVNVGYIDIPGTQITVEALIYLTSYPAPECNVVSKHYDPFSVNYLLRPYSFQLTTYVSGNSGTTQFCNMPNPYKLDLNKWYHIAGTYDGTAVKYYVNGCLVIEQPFTGNLFQNNRITTIGNKSNFQTDEQFYGMIDEVRIWKVCRTKDQIANNMLTLNNPTTETGLVAYYKFEGDYKNSQGNSSWDGTPIGSATFASSQINVDMFKITNVKVTNCSCSKQADGSIQLQSNRTNTTYSLDGVIFQSSNIFSKLKNGTYHAYCQSPEGCILDTTVLIQNSNNYNFVRYDKAICSGNSFFGYTKTGVYVDTISGGTVSCDTIRTINLKVGTPTFSITKEKICQGNNYLFNGVTYNTAGTYVSHLTNVTGCDSIATLILSVEQTSSSTTNATICDGDQYLFNSVSYSKAGAYSVHLTNAAGCDSVVTLQLKVNRSYNIKLIHDLCDNELPYVFTDTIFKSGTTTGNYRFQRKSMNGCDSIVTLQLTIHPLPTTLLSDTVVQHQAYSKYGFTIPAQNNYGFYTFYQHLKTVFGCDSTVILNLKVSPEFSAQAKASPQICVGDAGFTLGYDIVYGNVEEQSIVFDTKAQNAGFTDIARQTATGSIDVTLPANAIPDIYSASVVLDNGSVTKKLSVSFSVDYPSSVIVQKWNNVLALLNSSNNGGYQFTDYQWYKNGQAIDGATKSYLYLSENKLDTLSEYSVKLTRANDGAVLFTCPLIPTKHTDINIYPTVLSKAMHVTVKIEGTGKALLLNVSGLKIKEQLLNGGENSMAVPDIPGTYLLLVTNDQGQSKKQLLIVK